MAENDSDSAASGSPKKTWLYVVVGLVALVALYFLGSRLGDYIPQFAQWVESLGVWGPVAFIVGYILAAVLMAPGFLLTLAAGAIFGLAKGTIFTFIGATLGACAAFLIARYVARNAVERKLAGNERFATLDKAVGEQGLKIVTLLRLSPVFPFNLMNYGLGLTKVRFVDYAIACFGMIPGTLLYVYYGKLAGDLAAAVGGASTVEKGPEQWIFNGLGLLAAIIVTTIVARIAKKALSRETELDLDSEEVSATSEASTDPSTESPKEPTRG